MCENSEDFFVSLRKLDILSLTTGLESTALMPGRAWQFLVRTSLTRSFRAGDIELPLSTGSVPRMFSDSCRMFLPDRRERRDGEREREVGREREAEREGKNTRWRIRPSSALPVGLSNCQYARTANSIATQSESR